MMQPTPIELYFVGTRPYLQGAQMLTQALRQIERSRGQNALLLRETVFHKMATHPCVVGSEKQIGSGFELVATLTVEDAGEDFRYFIHENVAPDKSAQKSLPRIGVEPSLLEDTANDGSIPFQISADQNLLKALVQANRRVMDGLYPDVKQTRIVMLMDSEIPLDSIGDARGRATVVRESEKRAGNDIFAITSTTLECNGQTFGAKLLFSAQLT